MIKKHKIILLPFILAGILILVLVFDKWNSQSNVVGKIENIATKTIGGDGISKSKKNRNTVFTKKLLEQTKEMNFYTEESVSLKEREEIEPFYNILNSMELKEFVPKEVAKGGMSMDIRTEKQTLDIALYDKAAFINGVWYRTDDDYCKQIVEKIKELPKE